MDDLGEQELAFHFEEVPYSKAIEDDPFAGDGGSHRIPVAKEIKTSQLVDELALALGQSVAMVAWAPLDHDQPVGPGNESILCISPGTTDVVIVEQVVAAHEPNHELDPAQIEQERVIQKIRDGATLSTEEITIALRALVK